MTFIVVLRYIINKKSIFGHPPILLVYFILAKLLILFVLIFLLLRGLKIEIRGFYTPPLWSDIIAIIFLIMGSMLIIFTIFRLRSDLVFGLPETDKHTLQTSGIFSISRHPFYLGFIFIMFSSCLFNPHYINILSFLGAWLFHHFIMINEEKFLISKYGKTYIEYSKRVNRYITF